MKKISRISVAEVCALLIAILVSHWNLCRSEEAPLMNVKHVCFLYRACEHTCVYIQRVRDL